MPSATSVPLKYLFQGTYFDGARFEQNEEDVSITNPKRSSFFDVKVDEVKRFVLFHPMLDVDDRRVYGVDLEEGFFFNDYDDQRFYVGDPGPKPYKLIFWRQHTHEFTLGLDEISHDVKYCIGYTDADGIDHKILVD